MVRDARALSCVGSGRGTNPVDLAALGVPMRPGRGWHRRAVESESTLDFGNGSHRGP